MDSKDLWFKLTIQITEKSSNIKKIFEINQRKLHMSSLINFSKKNKSKITETNTFPKLKKLSFRNLRGTLGILTILIHILSD